ncbi:hypothetical protein BDW67DRAFT_165065 [Aspergillus spinulosporus]
MPMLSLLFFYALTGAVPVSAQSCASIIITSQASADSALDRCSSVSGSVTVAPSASGTLALDGLKRISEDLIIESTDLVGISLPDIEDVGGSVTVTGNEQLNRLSLGSLSNIGGDLKVQGNNALVDLVMDSLEIVRGGVHLAGGFNRLSFEELERVGGNSEIVATGSAGCADIGALNQAGSEEAEGEVFRGSYTCATTSASSTSTFSSTATTTSTPTSTSSVAATDSSADSGLDGGAIAGIVVGVVVGVLIILVLIWLFLRKRRKNRVIQGADAATIGGGFPNGAATAVIAKSKDEEKGPDHSTSPSTSPAEGSAPVLAATVAARGGGERGSIPRRPVSTATTSITSPSTYHPSSTFPSSLTAGTSNPSSMPLPTALIPGTNGSSNLPDGRRNDGEGDALFFTTTPSAARPPPRPARQPSESDVPMLDSENVHEISGVAVPAKGAKRSERIVEEGTVFELDGGFDGARHQRAINGEPEADGRSKSYI